MLRLYFGWKEDVMIDIPGYFDFNYEEEWIIDEFSKRAIKGVDKSDVIYPHVIISPVLGAITPKELSGGVKEVILMAFDDELEDDYFFGEQLGDNTLPYVLELAEKKEIRIAATHFLDFPENFNQEILIENTGRVVNSYTEYVEEYCKVV